jgi:hypothetical protein
MEDGTSIRSAIADRVGGNRTRHGLSGLCVSISWQQWNHQGDRKDRCRRPSKERFHDSLRWQSTLSEGNGCAGPGGLILARTPQKD